MITKTQKYTLDNVADMTLKLIDKVESLETELRQEINHVGTNIRSEMKEGFDMVNNRFERMDRRFDRLEERLDRTIERHDSLETTVRDDHEPRIIDLEKEAHDSK